MFTNISTKGKKGTGLPVAKGSSPCQGKSEINRNKYHSREQDFTRLDRTCLKLNLKKICCFSCLSLSPKDCAQ